jgi:bacillolysin
MKQNVRFSAVAMSIAMLFSAKGYAQQNNKDISSFEINNADSTYTSLTFSPQAAWNPQQAGAIFSKYFGVSGNNTAMVQISSTNTRQGVRTDRYAQYYKGIKVEYSSLAVTSKNNVVSFATGNYYKINSDIPSAPSLSESAALGNALKQVNARKYMWQDTAKEQMLKKITGKADTSYYPKASLVWVEDMLGAADRRLHLAYAFNVYAAEPLSREMIYVDAKTGKILAVNPLLENTAGNGASLYSGNVAFQAAPSGTGYVLHDGTRGGGINTYNCSNGDGSTATDFTSPSTTFGTNAALDAHWGAEKVYDYWLNVHGRNSFNNTGGAINSFVHYQVGYNNAYWDGYEMVYGDGTGIASGGFSPLVSLDVCAHEIGHAICQYTSGLVYNKEAGAMNEGFSDIWGAVIENYANLHETDAVAKNNWAIGEEISASSLRRMDNPNLKGQPDTYGGTYWYGVSSCTPSSSNDYCGVHRNSGVLNYWFYLLTQGGSGTNDIGNAFSLTGVGITKAADIVYQTELVLASNATYATCRTASINAAISLYGSCSAEVEAVTRAWYAVGVGANYTLTTSVIVGAANVCAGATTVYTNATSGGTWSSSNATVATVNTTGMVTGLSAGTAIITYNTGACNTTKIITVNATPGAISGSGSVCAGSTIALGNAVTGGTWSSSNTAVATISATGIVNAIAAGTSTITYTTGGGCQVTKTITVNAGPASIAGTTSTCAGNTVVLTNTTPGGTWSSSNTAVATTGLSSGVVTGIASGTTTITYTSAGGCYKTVTVTINALPVAGIISGSSTVAIGSAIGLTASAPGGVWTSSNASVASVNTAGIVTGVAGGTANITYTVNNSCGTASTIKTVTVAAGNAAPAFSGGASQSMTMCQNSAATSINSLMAVTDANSGQTETWSVVTAPAHGTLLGLSMSATSTGGLITPSGLTYTPMAGYSGTDVFTIRISDGYATTTTTVSVVINALPVAGVISGSSTVSTGATTGLTAAVSGGVWSSSNASVASVSTSGVVTGISAGTVNITYTVGNSCGTAYAVKTVTVSATNAAPAFTAGVSQSLTVCQNSSARSISSLMAITDANAGQTETWTVVTAPAHGTLSGFGISATSTGGVVTPSGMTYTPVAGYSGTDAFTIRVSDGMSTSTTTVNVTITGYPNAGTISGPASIATGASVAFTATVASGTWSSSNTGIATISSTTGLATGISAGNVTISYTVTNSCGSATATYKTRVKANGHTGVSSATTGVSEEGQKVGISIYPNPTSGAFTVESPAPGTLHLYSLQGALIGVYNLNAGITAVSLSSGLSPGIYIAKYLNKDGVAAEPVRIIYKP